MAAFEGLPEELMTLILLKLPVKSLLRFKCVHKSWYSLIKSPYFIHLHRSSINHDCFLLVRRSRHLKRHVLSLHSYETLDDLGIEFNIPMASAFLCGSCDGLVCISNYVDQIFICNPTIGELRSLSVPLPLGNESHYHIDSLAIGSDPSTGQYKVVMIGVPYDYDDDDEDDDNDDDFGDREARLYDFSTDSWRETAAVIPFKYSRRAISFNGAFHWCPADHIHGSILKFHIGNEVTEFIPLPDFAFEVSYYKQLCVSSNKSQLSLILYDFYGRLEICVMTEYGVKESWTRLFKIRPLLNILQPIAFWDEQRLLLRTLVGQLVSCDLQHKNIRHFPIDGDVDLCPYSQSLVSVFGIGDSII